MESSDIKIIKAEIHHAKILSKISVEAFLVPHGKAASKEEIDNYTSHHFSEENLIREISNPEFEYHIIYYRNTIVGFSKIVFNYPNENVFENNITKMERLYLLKEFYGLNLGKELLDFNIQLAKTNNQAGIWLYVWIENHRAIAFYKKMGFENVGSFDFEVSEKTSQPNHVLYLKF